MTARHRPATTAVGFVSPPPWVSPSMVEFLAVVEPPILPQQSIVARRDFDYTLAEIADAAPDVAAAAALLGEAGCSAVGMEGTPFAWAGCAGEQAARSRVAALAEAAGVPAVMAGTAIIDALRALGAERVALCPTYYPADWSDAWCGFVRGCGFDLVYCRSMADEGITGAIVDNDTYGWATGPELVGAAVSTAAERSGGVDAVVVTGAGARTTPIIGDLEERAGGPVVGADGALFWALAGAADLPLRPGTLGALTEAVA